MPNPNLRPLQSQELQPLHLALEHQFLAATAVTKARKPLMRVHYGDKYVESYLSQSLQFLDLA